jgi:hypothetical protein
VNCFFFFFFIIIIIVIIIIILMFSFSFLFFLRLFGPFPGNGLARFSSSRYCVMTLRAAKFWYGALWQHSNCNK